jgi:hypothetical protein
MSTVHTITKCHPALVLLVLLPAAPLAAAKFKYHPAEDGRLRVRATFKDKDPQVVFNEDVMQCKKVTITLPEDATDGDILLTPKRFLFSSLTEAAIIQGGPNNLFMADLDAGLFQVTGFNEVSFPVLFGETAPLFVTVDLTRWIANTTPFNEGDIFNFSDGRTSSLPGFLVGTQPISFDNQRGFFTDSPYAGLAQVLGTGGAQAVPEPSSILLVALALVTLALRRRATDLQSN